ncbi:MAG: hypothetical protein WC517_02670 [Patescibacteria group bacterium]
MIARNFSLFQPLGSFNLSDPDGYNAFKENIAGQIQGELALFQENWPTNVAALSFAVAYDLSDEALIRLASGKIALIFKHSSQTVAYPEKVDAGLAQKLAELIKNSAFVSETPIPRPTLRLDLAKLWNQSKQKDPLRHALIFAESLAAELKPTATINLFGELPILPLLSAILLARPAGRNIYYQQKLTAEKIRIF